jgi:hypothetical protein
MSKKRIPVKGDRVWVDGLNGEFTVIKVDIQRDVADLICITGASKVEKGIPFDAVHIATENVD